MQSCVEPTVLNLAGWLMNITYVASSCQLQLAWHPVINICFTSTPATMAPCNQYLLESVFLHTFIHYGSSWVAAMESSCVFDIGHRVAGGQPEDTPASRCGVCRVSCGGWRSEPSPASPDHLMMSAIPSYWTSLLPTVLRFSKHLSAGDCLTYCALCILCASSSVIKQKVSLFSVSGQGWSSMNFGMQSQGRCASLLSAAIPSLECSLALYMVAILLLLQPITQVNLFGILHAFRLSAFSWGHPTLLGEMYSTSGWATPAMTSSMWETCFAPGYAFVFWYALPKAVDS